MTDLPVARTSACHKAFVINGLNYFEHVNYVEGPSAEKAIVMLTASRAVHVEH